jgi:N-acetylglucosamine kinase-like BadF-type ATPase
MKNEKGFFLGVDGGGTKTESWLADYQGRIINKKRAGSSSLRNVGFQKSLATIVQTIKESLGKRKNIESVFIGLAAVEEEYKKEKPRIEREILKKFPFLRDRIFIGSDQEAAFRSGTDQKKGVVVIAGTGCVARGWNNSKDIKASGWGWLADEGSASWVGLQAYQAILKSLDNRGEKTLLAKNFKKVEDLNKKAYNDPLILTQLSLMVDSSALQGDKQAQKILVKAGQELALSALTVIKKLNFKKEFPLVKVGGMFNSEILRTTFEKEIEKNNTRALIITPLNPPVYGALRLAFEKHEVKRKR